MYVTVTVLEANLVDDDWVEATIAVEFTPGTPHDTVAALLRAAADKLEEE